MYNGGVEAVFHPGADDCLILLKTFVFLKFRPSCVCGNGTVMAHVSLRGLTAPCVRAREGFGASCS